MSHVFQLTDEQYEKLAAYAAKRKETVEMLFQRWVNEVTHNLEEERLNDPLFQIAGMFAIGDPYLAEKHDEYLAETYRENHAEQ